MLTRCTGNAEVNYNRLINLDFADVKSIMKDAGPAWMSIGKGLAEPRHRCGKRRLPARAQVSIQEQGRNFLIGRQHAAHRGHQAADVIKGAGNPEANIIPGVANDPALDQEVRITLVATGFNAKMGMGKENAEEEQLTKILKNMRTEEELDMPSFLRRPMFSRRQQQQPEIKNTRNEPVRQQRHFV